jgi:polyisoprenyl-teichoic acid--peptidoglycan teichoic acid transferase
VSSAGWEERPAELGPARPGRDLLKRGLLGALVLMVLSGAATATAVLLEVADLSDEFNKGAPAIAGAPVTAADAGRPQTFLIVGSDRRFKDRKDKKNARSDTIILVRLNPQAETSTVMSIPRDLKVRLKRDGPPDKINQAFSVGGPAGTARVVKRTLSFPGRPFRINHIVNVNFGGFSAVVNQLGCVFGDVDRNYFNDNNPPAGGGEPYAVIDIKPGYQRLCGQDALDYVRFRHADTDIVRAARQQTFLGAMRQQYAASRLFGDRKRLARITGRYTQTDRALHRENELLKILNLVLFSGRKPVQEVHFPAKIGDADDPFVTTNRAKLSRAVEQFMRGDGGHAPRPESKPKARGKRRTPGGPVPGLVDGSAAGQSQVASLGATKLPRYYPRLITAKGRYMDPVDEVYPRRYSIRYGGRRYGAYRLTLDAGAVGEFYGVQGTSWRNPPILRDPSETRRVNGRKLLLFFDGSRLQTVGWKTRRGSYWVSNTLLESIGNRQMLAIAGSLTRRGTR